MHMVDAKRGEEFTGTAAHRRRLPWGGGGEQTLQMRENGRGRMSWEGVRGKGCRAKGPKCSSLAKRNYVPS